jgi:predicted anti-sigma-YlaC factor YlaD
MAELDPICRRVRENLSAYLDGELKGDARRLLDEHLSGCEACRRQMQELKDTWRLLDELEAPIVPRAFHDQVLARVEVEEKMSPFRRVVRALAARGALGGLAATLAAALFVTGFYISTRPPSRVPSPTEVECITYLDFLRDLETLKNIDEIKYVKEVGGQLSEPDAVAEGEGPGA